MQKFLKHLWTHAYEIKRTFCCLLPSSPILLITLVTSSFGKAFQSKKQFLKKYNILGTKELLTWIKKYFSLFLKSLQLSQIASDRAWTSKNNHSIQWGINLPKKIPPPSFLPNTEQVLRTHFLTEHLRWLLLFTQCSFHVWDCIGCAYCLL